MFKLDKLQICCAAFLSISLTAIAAEPNEAVSNPAATNPSAATAVTGTVSGSEQYTKLPSGLQYLDVKVGSGPAARAGKKVTVHYTGWLKGRLGIPGKKFDSSHDHGEPFQFTLGMGEVIAGWDEGVQGMQVGGIRKLVVPSYLGYGAKGAGDSIPPNATLIFEVELLGL